MIEKLYKSSESSHDWANFVVVYQKSGLIENMDLSKYLGKVQGVIGKSSFTTMLSGLDLTITQEWVAEEHFMYGSSRLGVYRSNKTLSRETFEVTEISNEGVITGRTVIDSFLFVMRTDSFTRVLTQKNYELSNHLGNVLAVVSDRRTPTSSGGINIDYYDADVTSATLFYPFGSEMKTYAADSNGYRFGFGGQERDDEVFKGAYSAEYWEYDSRIGRRWNIDPMAGKYPWQSPYACFNNNPIFWKDPQGLEGTNDPPKTVDYTVKENDNLKKIADANGTTPEAIIEANSKADWGSDRRQGVNNWVFTGENLKIPIKPEPSSNNTNEASQVTAKDALNTTNFGCYENGEKNGSTSEWELCNIMVDDKVSSAVLITAKLGYSIWYAPQNGFKFNEETKKMEADGPYIWKIQFSGTINTGIPTNFVSISKVDFSGKMQFVFDGVKQSEKFLSFGSSMPYLVNPGSEVWSSPVFELPKCSDFSQMKVNFNLGYCFYNQNGAGYECPRDNNLLPTPCRIEETIIILNK